MNEPPIFEIHCIILRDGSVVNNTACHGSTFAEAYAGLMAVRDEVDRQIADRRSCPFNPKYGDGGASLGDDWE
jgi:hypothetical protein